MDHLKRHLSVANALSCLALFVALSGVAYAAALGKNSVKTKNIAKGAVTTQKLRNGAVTTPKLGNEAVIATKIATGNVGSTQLADGGVRSVDLGGSVVTSAKLKNGAVTNEKLANDAVTSAKLAAEAVATGKLGKESVTAEKVSAGLFGQLVKNVSYVSEQTVANAEADPKFITAQCPAGKEAIGGGARVTGAGVTNVAVTESFATSPDVNGKRTGWHAVAMPMAAEAEAWGVEAVAVCAEL